MSIAPASEPGSPATPIESEEVCPACGSPASVPEDVVLGEVLWCDHCGAELEVVSTAPLRLDLFEEEEK